MDYWFFFNVNFNYYKTNLPVKNERYQERTYQIVRFRGHYLSATQTSGMYHIFSYPGLSIFLPETCSQSKYNSLYEEIYLQTLVLGTFCTTFKKKKSIIAMDIIPVYGILSSNNCLYAFSSPSLKFKWVVNRKIHSSWTQTQGRGKKEDVVPPCSS